ncbi:MAG: hypothetical protein K5Q00_06535 [Gammaproteobacteria bacterium]|nr:hypothetical protein [Gammaproteobacteria bacterium]
MMPLYPSIPVANNLSITIISFNRCFLTHSHNNRAVLQNLEHTLVLRGINLIANTNLVGSESTLTFMLSPIELTYGRHTLLVSNRLDDFFSALLELGYINEPTKNALLSARYSIIGIRLDPTKAAPAA